MPRPIRFRLLLPMTRHAAMRLSAASWLAAVPAGAQPIRALVTPTAGIPATAPVPPRPLTREDLEAGTLRVGPVRFDRAFHAELRSAFAGGLEAPPRTITVSPFPDVTFTLVLRRSPFAALSEERVVLSGEVQQVGGAAAVSLTPLGGQGSYSLVLYGSELTLSIFSPAGNYHIHPGQFGRLEAFQEDPAAPVRCGRLQSESTAAHGAESHAAAARGAPASVPAAARTGAVAASAAAADARSEVVVLALYTDEAVSAMGGEEAGLQAEITKGVDLANTAFQRSGIQVTARLATGQAVRIPASFRSSADFASDLTNLEGNAEIAALRVQHRADVVTLARGRGDAWGIAEQLGGPGSQSAARAFGIVYARKFADGLVFAHELGHTLGAAHDPEHVDSDGALPYARGWHAGVGEDARRATHVGTIMSTVGQRIPYFSTPRAQYQGVPVGSERQDNARAINASRTIVAAYQQ